MWSCDIESCTNGVEASKGWVFIAHFSIYSASRCCPSYRDWHSETPCSHSSNQPGGMYCQALDSLLRTNYWKCVAQVQNWRINPHLPCEKTCHSNVLGVIIVALNGKSASMLLESTKNELEQWLVIEKSVNKCNFFSRYFEIITIWIKITEKQICEDQIVTFKQSHILGYMGGDMPLPTWCWNLNILENQIYAMLVDVLAPCITKASAVVIMAGYYKKVLIFHQKGFRLP